MDEKHRLRIEAGWVGADLERTAQHHWIPAHGVLLSVPLTKYTSTGNWCVNKREVELFHPCGVQLARLAPRGNCQPGWKVELGPLLTSEEVMTHEVRNHHKDGQYYFIKKPR